ncbi:MAG: energy transducer TonB [Candidatus Acidiferrum sp.]
MVLVCFSPLSQAQTAPPENQRKIKEAFKPECPELARRLHLSGVVRVEVHIAPDGKVTKAHVVGGHPVLSENAEKAALLTRFESAAKETTQTIEFRFDTEK